MDTLRPCGAISIQDVTSLNTSSYSELNTLDQSIEFHHRRFSFKYSFFHIKAFVLVAWRRLVDPRIGHHRGVMGVIVPYKCALQYSPLLSWHRFRFCWRTKTHISENENAYFRERRRIFQRTKTKKKTKTRKNENAKNANAKKKRRRIKTKTQKNASLLGHYAKPVDYRQLFYI